MGFTRWQGVHHRLQLLQSLLKMIVSSGFLNRQKRLRRQELRQDRPVGREIIGGWRRPPPAVLQASQDQFNISSSPRLPLALWRTVASAKSSYQSLQGLADLRQRGSSAALSACRRTACSSSTASCWRAVAPMILPTRLAGCAPALPPASRQRSSAPHPVYLRNRVDLAGYIFAQQLPVQPAVAGHPAQTIGRIEAR